MVVVVVVVVVVAIFFNISSLKTFDAAAAITLEDISLSVRKLSPECSTFFVGLDSI